MLVGVCCECQQGGKPLRYHRSGAVLDVHDAFGSPCKGEGSAPQATYQDSSGSDQMPEGVQVVIGNDPVCPDDFDREEHNRIQDRIQEDQFEREEKEREQTKEAEKFVCCFDPWCNHRPDPKPPGIFGTIGDILRTASSKGTNKGKRKRA